MPILTPICSSCCRVVIAIAGSREALKRGVIGGGVRKDSDDEGVVQENGQGKVLGGGGKKLEEEGNIALYRPSSRLTSRGR